MRALIRERRVIHGLPSASALERVGDFYFVIGDDASDLFRLDLNFNLVGTTRLFETNTRERIAKASKPDFEAMCCVEWRGARELLCFGSGSKSPTRDVCYRVDVTNPASPQNARAVALTALYDALRANAEFTRGHQLNFEAAATTTNTLSLFQRGNISGNNAQIEFDLRAFMEYLDAPTRTPPQAHLKSFALPQIKNRRAGFSAAIAVDDSIFFTASVEDTDNEIDDGATLGSFIGRIDAKELSWIAAVEQNGETAPVKIEGLALRNAHDNSFQFVAVTDNDDGESEILQIQVH